MPTPLEIQNCINSLNTSSEPVEFIVLAAETLNSNTGISFTVATVNDLPDLETDNIGQGQMIFVESIGVPVISSINRWIGLDGRVLRKDFNDSAIFSWGGPDFNGASGTGTTGSACSPVREICFSTDWCQVSAGGHTTAIKTSGEIWSWGTNNTGQLGDGTVVTKCSPVREICSATDWCRVSAGRYHTAAIKTSGQLWSWGNGSCGRLGNGCLCSCCLPVRDFTNSTWSNVSAGGYHTAAIKTSGQLWAWGSNNCGQVGDGTITGRCSPVRDISSSTDWCQVSAGKLHSAAIKTSGELWMWGSNNFGQLGDGTITTRTSPVREISSSTDWCQVSAAIGLFGCSAVAVKTSGELWGWGYNFPGQLGDGTTTTRCSPVREFCSATDWCQASAGASHTAAVKTSGQLWTWGNNNCGRLGDGTLTNSCSPVREYSSETGWCMVSIGAANVSTAILIK